MSVAVGLLSRCPPNLNFRVPFTNTLYIEFQHGEVITSIIKNYSTIPNFLGAAIEIWELTSNFIPHFTWYVINYPCWDKNKLMLVSKWEILIWEYISC